MRYIHLNPMWAGIVKDNGELNGYPLTDHEVIMGRIGHKWQDAGYVLDLFAKRTGVARNAYRQFVSKGISQGRRLDLMGGGLKRSVGG